MILLAPGLCLESLFKSLFSSHTLLESLLYPSYASSFFWPLLHRFHVSTQLWPPGPCPLCPGLHLPLCWRYSCTEDGLRRRNLV